MSYPAVKQEFKESGIWEEHVAPLIDWLVEAGEFADFDEAEVYLANVVAQQSSEALSADKVSVLPIENSGGGYDSYRVTVDDSSAQVLMSVNAVLNVTCAGAETPEFLGFFKYVYGDRSPDELYPNGMSFDLDSGKGELDPALYYSSANDTLADLYERIYSSPTSVWTLPRMTDECLALYDLDGVAHLVGYYYLDESLEYAYVPLCFCTPEMDWYGYGKLILRCADGEWSIYGVSYEDKDVLSFVVSPSEAGLDDYLITTGALLTDSVYNYTTTVPISSYFPIDAAKENWGFSFGKVKLSELDDVAGFRASYVLSDVYGGRLNITPAFEAADEAAKRGDLVRDISVTDITVDDAVYTGNEASPVVTVSYDGRTLVNGVDFKVIYDGSSAPGSAYLTVFGIGDFCGALGLDYTIKDSFAVKVDGKEIGEDQFTVNENTGAVTLTDEYQKTLAPGVHTLTVVLSGAEMTTNFTVPAADDPSAAPPQPGDDSPVGLWLILMSVSAVGAISLVLFDKKQRVSEK